MSSILSARWLMHSRRDAVGIQSPNYMENEPGRECPSHRKNLMQEADPELSGGPNYVRVPSTVREQAEIPPLCWSY